MICNTPVLRLTHMSVPPAELGKGVHTGMCSQPLQILGCLPRKHREPCTESILKNLTKPPALPGREKQVAMSECVHTHTCAPYDRDAMTKAQTEKGLNIIRGMNASEKRMCSKRHFQNLITIYSDIHNYLPVS